MVRIGLGKLFSFEFVSPCFETGKVKTRHQQIKNETHSVYGRVEFDFEQFGKNDDQLKKQQPKQYCTKLCHTIGFYLQNVHGYDILRMKVDFNQDDFGEIWLMQVDQLLVRKARSIPSDKRTQLADYVLGHFKELDNTKILKEMIRKKREAELERKIHDNLKEGITKAIGVHKTMSP